MTALGVVVRVSLLGAVCAGCVKIPPFQQQDGGPGDGNGDGPPGDANGDGALVKVEPDGNDVLVTAPGYTMRFGSEGSKFPYQLSPAGNHLMGGSQQCADEHMMGIALYPFFRIAAQNATGVGTPTVTIPLEGPYVGQVRIQWNAGCASGSGSLTGHTTFSFFPDGRLARFDVISNAAVLNIGDCQTCSGASATGDLVLASYTTLIVDPGATLSDGNEATLDTYGEEVPNVGPTACVRQRQQSIAFSWGNGLQSRLRVVDDTPSRTISFVKDLYRGSSLPMDDFLTTTQIAVSASDNCAALENRIRQWSDDDHQLVINGNSVGTANADGIYGGDPREEGYPVDFPVTLTPAQTSAPRVPAGFAVWLYSQPIPSNLTLTHSGGPSGTSWYRLQRVGNNSLVIWFDVPLEDGQTITISGS